MVSDSSLKVLAYLKKYPDKEVSKYDLAEDLGLSMASVTASVTHFLRKRGFATERIEELPAMQGGKPLTIRWIKITPEGMAYDPFEEERQKLRERAELSAKRKQERAEKKAERAKVNSVM